MSKQKENQQGGKSGVIREFKTSRFVHLKRRVSLVFDTFFEKISTRIVHLSLMLLNIGMLFLLLYGIFVYGKTESMSSSDGGDTATSKDKLTDEKDTINREALESAVRKAMIPKTNFPKPKYPFAKINAWGEIKPLDDKWFTHALFDVYVFLLSEMKISTQDNSRQVIDIAIARMFEYFNQSPTSNKSEFLVSFFREHLLLRSYDNSATDNPLEILKNLGESEFDVTFLVLAVLSKIGVTPEIYTLTSETHHQFLLKLDDKKIQIYFSGNEPTELGRPIEINDFFELFLKHHISRSQGIAKRVKLNELLEDIKPTNEVYRTLCNLYGEWSKTVEDPTLKEQYHQKMKYYRQFLPIDNPEDLYIIALGAYNDGNIQESWSKFNTLIESYTDYVSEKGESAYFYLSRMGSDRFATGAIDARQLSGYLDKLDYQNRAHISILAKCAYLFYERKKFNEAMKVFDNLEKHGFADVRLYSARSEIKLELKSVMPAIANLKAAISLSPRNRKLRAKLIQTLIDNEMYDEACKECEKAAKSEAKMIYALKVGAMIAEQHLNNLSLAERLISEFEQLSK